MFVTGVGMVCPVGLNAASACAAKRAGLSAFEETPYRDNAREPIVGAAVPSLSWEMTRQQRLLALLIPTLTELLGRHPSLFWREVPLLLCLAEPERPGGGDRSTELARSLVDTLAEHFGIRFHPVQSRVLAGGQTAGFRALQEAQRLFAENLAAGCIVCGVDSLLNAATLATLDRNYRLKTARNRDGLIPGEAAAAVLLEAHPRPGSSLQIVGLGFGQETAPVLSGQPLLGLGMTTAVRAALDEAGMGFHEIDVRLSDATGELYGFKELPLTEGRLARVVRKKAQALWQWAEAIGDSGAAAGMAQLVLAEQAFRKGYAPGAHALGLTAAESGARAAVVLRQARP